MGKVPTFGETGKRDRFDCASEYHSWAHPCNLSSCKNNGKLTERVSLQKVCKSLLCEWMNVAETETGRRKMEADNIRLAL